MKGKGILNTMVLLILVLLCFNGMVYVNSQKVPAMFVFGDSIVEVGNNNFLNTLAKSNYYPYGIDYNRVATGRFSNGRSLIDFIGNMMGVPSPPPFLDPSTTGSRILNGVNYASASGGILEESGRHYGDRLSMGRQIQNFQSTLNQYKTMMNPTELNQFLAKSLVVVVTGNNDYINNYLLPGLYASSSNYTAPEFANHMINNLARQMLALYSLGLRKIFIAGVGPLGCIPNQRATGSAPSGRCVDSVNQIVGFYNTGLRSTVEQLNRDHPGAIFAYGNTYGVLGDILNNPAAYSFSVVDRACCGFGRNRGQISCLPLQLPCLSRERYLFWDAFHPTESAVYVFAWRAVNGPPNDVYPMNIKQMSVV
ncbi:unnamed protein product [Lathyrus oleraceus]|nr:GDSL esterase/lipase At1g71250 [Pisum sativum]